MTTFLCALFSLATQGTPAAADDGTCLMMNRHKARLDRLVARVGQMNAPDLNQSQRFTCELTPGYGCLSRTQRDLPMTLVRRASGATLEVVEGFPMMSQRTHFAYLRDQFAVAGDGTLRGRRPRGPGGFARQSPDGRTYVVITEPFTRRFGPTDDPTLTTFTKTPERVLRAYACAPVRP